MFRIRKVMIKKRKGKEPGKVVLGGENQASKKKIAKKRPRKDIYRSGMEKIKDQKRKRKGKELRKREKE